MNPSQPRSSRSVRAASILVPILVGVGLYAWGTWGVHHQPSPTHSPVTVPSAPTSRPVAESAEPDEDEEARIDEAAKLLDPAANFGGGVELVRGRKYAFLAFGADQVYRVAVVEDGVVRTLVGRDRWLWETCRPEDFVHQWAGRCRPAIGVYVVESVEKRPFDLTAILKDHATLERFRLRMTGFHADGSAILSLTPLPGNTEGHPG